MEQKEENETSLYDSFEPDEPVYDTFVQENKGIYETPGYSYFSAEELVKDSGSVAKGPEFMFFQYGPSQSHQLQLPSPPLSMNTDSTNATQKRFTISPVNQLRGTRSLTKSAQQSNNGQFQHTADSMDTTGDHLPSVPEDDDKEDSPGPSPPAPMLRDLGNKKTVAFTADTKPPSSAGGAGAKKRQTRRLSRSASNVSGRFAANVTDEDLNLQKSSGLGIDEDAWDQSLDRCFEFQSAAKHFLQQRSNHRRGHALIGAAKELADLAQDFFNDAQLYGRVIISEQFLPDEQKTILPSTVGGIAGGEKYIIASRGIMFKFATDFKGVYGGDNWAQKAANHELRSLIALYNLSIPDLYFPLMAVIDYFGYRLLAVSILPVLGKSTLRYGSCDQGRSVHLDNPDLNAKMAECGARLNLKQYSFHNKTMHICSDFEVHEGNPEMLNERMKRSESSSCEVDVATLNLDENMGGSVSGIPKSEAAYYICDMARVFPPCCVIPQRKYLEMRPPRGTRHPNMQLYRTFRPRFVATYPKPLCAEAYSKMQDQQGMMENANELMEAVRVLHTQKVQEFATHLEELDPMMKDLYPQQFDLTEEMHKHGLNMHLLGLVRQAVKDPKWRQICETEMLARVGKNLIRERLRERSKRDKVVSEVTGRHIIADTLTEILFDTKKEHYDFRHRYTKQINSVDKFWDHDLEFYLQEAFFDYSILYFQSDYMKQTAVGSFIEEARISLARDKLLERILHMLGVTLEEASVVWRLSDQNFAQPFLPSEISLLPVQTACMDVISQAEGMMLYAQALELCGPQCRGLLRMAIPRLKRAVKVLQNSGTAHHWLGQALYELAIREPDAAKAADHLSMAKKHLKEAADLTESSAHKQHGDQAQSISQEDHQKMEQEVQDYKTGWNCSIMGCIIWI